MPRPLPEPPEHLEVTQVLHALADPVRLSIVRQLERTDGPVTCGRFDVEVGKSTLSHHLRTLREAGIVQSARPDGRSVENSLRRSAIDTAFPGLLDAIL